jgi:hypothetical protein
VLRNIDEHMQQEDLEEKVRTNKHSQVPLFIIRLTVWSFLTLFIVRLTKKPPLCDRFLC